MVPGGYGALPVASDSQALTALEFDQHDPPGEDFSQPDVGDVPMKKHETTMLLC